MSRARPDRQKQARPDRLFFSLFPCFRLRCPPPPRGLQLHPFDIYPCSFSPSFGQAICEKILEFFSRKFSIFVPGSQFLVQLRNLKSSWLNCFIFRRKRWKIWRERTAKQTKNVLDENATSHRSNNHSDLAQPLFEHIWRGFVCEFYVHFEMARFLFRDLPKFLLTGQA